MASTFYWMEANGAQSFSPFFRGTSETTGITNISLKNTDDSNTSYTSSTITAGNYSFPKFIFGYFSGSFNSISNIKFNHVSGNFNNGIGLHCFTGASGFYTTPSASQVSSFIFNLTQTGLLSTGISVHIGVNAPWTGSKSSTSSMSPSYTSYIGIQLSSSASTSAGNVVTSSPNVYSVGISWEES